MRAYSRGFARSVVWFAALALIVLIPGVAEALAPDPPPQPAVSGGNGQITVTFSAPASDGGSPITGYTADCTSSDGGTPGTNNGSDTTPIVVSGLDNGHLYTCTITATNADGPSAPSAASDPVTPSTVPDAPPKPTVASGNGQITVTFSAPASDGGSPITGYTADCTSSDGGTPGTNTGAGAPITVSSLDNGHLYTCTVTATNANGSGAASPASDPVTPNTLPAAPAKPSARAGDARISVSFVTPDDGGAPITTFTARCSSSNGGTTHAVTRSSSPITVSGLTNTRTYSCRVRATNSNGTGPWSSPSSNVIPVARPHGFRLFSGDGGVFTFGKVGYYGSAAGRSLARVITMAATPSGRGYWLVATDGRVFAFGDAHSYGFPRRLNKPIVGMTPTWTGKGYWLVATDGGIFAYGDAHFYGSTGNIRLQQPIVGMASTPSGRGYWMVARDGGLFTFGDAHFYGSAVHRTNQAFVGMATNLSGHGYWLAADGGAVFAFGNTRYLGGTKPSALRLPVRGITSTQTGRGYWLAAGDGSVFAFGDAPWFGWPGPIRLRQTIRGVSR